PQGTIKPDDFAIQNRVAHHLVHHHPELFRFTEAFRERQRGCKAVLHFLGHTRQHWCHKQARSNAIHPNPFTGQLAGRLQGQGHHTAFGCAVSRLANLAFVGSNRSGIDDDTALAIIVGFPLRHVGCRQPQNIEGTNQVDLDYLTKTLQWHDAFPAQNLRRWRNARTVHRDTAGAVSLSRSSESSLSTVSRGHIAMQEDAPELSRNLLALFLVHIKNRNLAASRRQSTCSALTQTGGTACYNCRHILEFHRVLLINNDRSLIRGYPFGPQKHFTFT